MNSSLCFQNADKSNNQEHLKFQDRINLGAFYTPQEYIDIVWDKIAPFLTFRSVVLDSSCGYGNFFNCKIKCQKKANDIDPIAVKKTKKNFPEVEVFNKNALLNVSRKMFNISYNDDLIIIGNPPYNDTTSMIRNNIKKNTIQVDFDIKTRDFGMSFLLSYAKLNADIICVLHPLSYLVKKTNFNLLKKFVNNYKLIDSVVIDSGTFKETSKGISFPIIIALYKKDKLGMNYDYIQNYRFETIDGHNFALTDFDFIPNYINKYPLKNKTLKEDDILFWTMRDINALKRNRTFVHKFTPNTIIIDKSRLEYYVYVDVFKQFTCLLPYYFGNLDVFINNSLFQKYKKYFFREIIDRHPFLKKYITYDESISIQEAKENIMNYFKILIGDHYVY